MDVRGRIVGLAHSGIQLVVSGNRKARESVPRTMRTAELAVGVTIAAAFAVIYRGTPVVAVALCAAVAVTLVSPRLKAPVFPLLVAAAAAGAGTATFAPRLLLIFLLLASWHIDGLRKKGVVYAGNPVPLLRYHILWFASVALASILLVLIGSRVEVALPGWATILLPPVIVSVTTLIARSHSESV